MAWRPASWKTKMQIMPLLLLLAVTCTSLAGVLAARSHTGFCPEASEAVFPYWSVCGNPATYGAPYQIQSQASGSSRGYYLAPEWDETNTTFYVRLVADSSSAATYRFEFGTSQYLRPYVAVAEPLIIVNVESGRALAWRKEGDEQFLVEVDYDSHSYTWLEFSPDNNSGVLLPCPLILGARCQAYDIVSAAATSAGLAAYEEDGAVYFKLASDGLVPFVLRTTSALRTTVTGTAM